MKQNDLVITKVFKDIKSKTSNKIYSVILTYYNGEFNLDKSSCTCKWGSFYGLSKKNKNKLCRHMKEAKNEYEKKMENK